MSKNNVNRNRRIARRRQAQRKTRLLVLACFLVCSLTVIFAFTSTSVVAHQDTYKYYTDVKVKANDTLWDIAQEYCSEEYDSIQDYIDEVRQINGISYLIYEGQTIVVPYYSSGLK